MITLKGGNTEKMILMHQPVGDKVITITKRGDCARSEGNDLG